MSYTNKYIYHPLFNVLTYYTIILKQNVLFIRVENTLNNYLKF